MTSGDNRRYFGWLAIVFIFGLFIKVGCPDCFGRSLPDMALVAIVIYGIYAILKKLSEMNGG